MFKVISDVENEPVTLAEARFECGMTDDDPTDGDARLTALIEEGRKFAEHYCGRAFASRTLEMALDAFPAGDIELDMPPVTSVTSIKYTDTAGVEQTFASSDYALSPYGEAPRTISLAYGASWPSAQCVKDAVRIRYVTGFASCPKAIRSAILLHVKLGASSLTADERANNERARDSLLDTQVQY